MNFKTAIGTIRTIADRVQSYIGMVNFAMILYLFIVTSPMGVEPMVWVGLLILFLPIIAIIDWVIIYPVMLDINFGKKNKEFQEIKKDIKLIKNKLGIDDDKIG